MKEGTSFSKLLADRIRKTTALSNKTRLRVVLSIFSSETLGIGNSLTLSQLEKMLDVDKHELAYHLKVLKEVKIIDKENHTKGDTQKTYYKTTEEGVKILEFLGISKNKVKELSKGLGIAA